MSKSYYGIEVAFPPGDCEKIYNLLYLEGIDAILEENGLIKFCLEEKDLPRLENLKKKLFQLTSLTEHGIRAEKLENRNWHLEWEKSVMPVFIKDKIIVYPSWKKNELAEYKDRIPIEIDPKMSFGTAQNETTQMMLEMICDYIEETDNYLLDFGCGTAVLAIAAIKLGAAKAVAADIDEDAIRNAQENIEKNSVSGSILLQKGGIENIAESGFDIIVSNIDLAVIAANLKTLHLKLKPGGKLLVSGFHQENENEISQSLKEHKFKLHEIRKKAGWLSLYCRKK